MLFDIRRPAVVRRELCDVLGVPIGALPDVSPTSGRFGVTAETTALGAGHPDQRRGRRSTVGAVRPGLLLARHDQEHLRHRQLRAHEPSARPAPSRSTGCSPRSPGRSDRTSRRPIAYEGAIFVTGAAIQWLRDGLGMIDDAAEIGPLALRRTTTGDVMSSCRPSPASAARGGTRTPGERSSG